jgi:hypothetical protein
LVSVLEREDMMGSGDEPGLRRAVTDEEAAEAMLAMAEAFRTAAATDDDALSWGASEAARLDGICAAFLAERCRRRTGEWPTRLSAQQGRQAFLRRPAA